MTFQRQTEGTAELCQLNFGLLTKCGDLRLRSAERGLRLIDIGLRGTADLDQGQLTIVIRLVELPLRELRIDVAQHALVVLFHRADGQLGLCQLRARIGESDLEWPRIE